MSDEKSFETKSRKIRAQKMLPLDDLKEFEKNTFKKYKGEQLAKLVESIKLIGVTDAILVRPINDTSTHYEIICGHNRVNAAIIAGLKEIPARINEMTDDEAIIAMAESNLRRREEVLPSERAHTYKVQLEAIKNQGKRNDLIDATSYQDGGKLEASEKIAKAHKTSSTQVRRYIALTELIPEFLDDLDDKKIDFMPAVNISSLSKIEQKILHEVLSENKIKLSVNKSKELKKSAGELSKEIILEVLFDKKGKDDFKYENKRKEAINVLQSVFENQFKGYKKSEIESILKDALKLHLDNSKSDIRMDN